jgi:hypothetical protein
VSRAWLATRAAIVVVMTAALSLSAAGVPAASAAPASTAVTAQQAGLDEMMLSYTGNLIGTSWWQAAVAQSTLETYQQATGDTSYDNDIVATYNAYNGNDPSGMPDFEDDYLDDTGWWALAWLQFYTMTGNTSYLQTAEAAASYIHQYWNSSASVCGGAGGVFWEVTSSGPSGRVSISNEVFLELTAWLYNVTGNATYLSWANAEWSWLGATGLISSSGLVYDGLGGTGCAPAGTFWTYNQGVILAGLAQLYTATGNASLLTEAEKIAGAAIAALAPDGVLTETCQPSGCDSDQTSFKGIFVRDLKVLATTAGTSQYNSFFSAQAKAIINDDTNGNGQLGLAWSGPAPSCPAGLTAGNACDSQTQVSAEDALVAVISGPVVRPAAVVDIDGTVRVFARAAGGSLETDSLAPGAAAWSGWASLGGNSPTSPSALAAASGATWAFVTSAGGSLYGDQLPAGSAAWSGWAGLGSPAGTHLIGVPAVVADHSGVIRVFTRGANGNLYADSLSGGTWSGFTDLGGIWPQDVTALVGSGGYLHIYAVGTTANLYTAQLPPGGSWSGWTDLGGEVTGVPAVAQDSSGTLRAYARQAPGGGLLEYYANSGATTYATDTHGGTWPYDEAAVAGTGTHTLNLFGIGSTDNAYWEYLTSAPAWNGWDEMYGAFAGVPAAVRLSNGSVDVFADSAGSLEADQLSGSTWSGWTSLGGGLA